MPSIDEIQTQLTKLLQALRFGRQSEQFYMWQQSAKALLLEIDRLTGNDFRQRFDSISYDPPPTPDHTVNIQGYNDEYNIILVRANAAHEKGLLQARGVLTSALQWITQHGIESPLQNTTRISSLHNGIPADIDQIPLLILRNIPDIHDVIIKYLSEAITCLHTNACLAATIMIGCASEKAIYLLMESFIDNIENPRNKEAFFKRYDKYRDISKKYEVFEASFKSYHPKPVDPRINGVGFDTAVRDMFQYCRKERNDVGHPKTIPNLTPELVMMPLRHFPIYLQCIYALMAHFSTHKVTL